MSLEDYFAKPSSTKSNKSKKINKNKDGWGPTTNMEASTPADEAELNLLLAMEKMTENIMCTIDAKICSVL